jgi:hypothetical protein
MKSSKVVGREVGNVRRNYTPNRVTGSFGKDQKMQEKQKISCLWLVAVVWRSSNTNTKNDPDEL